MTQDVVGAIRAAADECDRARRWHRLTCWDADVFARRARLAESEGEDAIARTYAGRADAANRARQAAWTEYRESVATLASLLDRRGLRRGGTQS